MAKKILIVDDEPGIIEVMVDYIKMSDLDVKVISAESVDKALELVLKQKPDLIVTDIAMPNKNGIEFLREIRIRQLKIPVVVVTGHADEYMLEQAWKVGANACLRKPLNRKDFINGLSELLQKGSDFIYDSASVPSPRVVHLMLSQELMKKAVLAASKSKLSVEDWIVAGVEASVN